MTKIVVYDTEYLAKNGSMKRMWSGSFDPDPIVVQIGAVLLDLEHGGRIVDQTRIFLSPIDRHGEACCLDPYFVELTGITEKDLSDQALNFDDALDQFDAFSKGFEFWSWGKDELILLGMGCFIRGIPAPIPIRRFNNLRQLFGALRILNTDDNRISSGELPQHFGLKKRNLRHHDALGDALSLAETLIFLLQQGAISEASFQKPG